MLGKVECYNSTKKWGYIYGDDGTKYFLHESEIKLPSKFLSPGYSVEFTPHLGTKGWRAANVYLI